MERGGWSADESDEQGDELFGAQALNGTLWTRRASVGGANRRGRGARRDAGAWSRREVGREGARTRGECGAVRSRASSNSSAASARTADCEESEHTSSEGRDRQHNSTLAPETLSNAAGDHEPRESEGIDEAEESAEDRTENDGGADYVESSNIERYREVVSQSISSVMLLSDGEGGEAGDPEEFVLSSEGESWDALPPSDPARPALEISASQVANGEDIQGVPWRNLPFTREHYRATRLLEYYNYRNLVPDLSLRHEVKGDVQSDAQFYRFRRNSRRAQCSVMHFQLRNLVWCTSKHDVYMVHQDDVLHWDAARQRVTQLLHISASHALHAGGLAGVNARESGGAGTGLRRLPAGVRDSPPAGFNANSVDELHLDSSELALLEEEQALAGISSNLSLPRAESSFDAPVKWSSFARESEKVEYVGAGFAHAVSSSVSPDRVARIQAARAAYFDTAKERQYRVESRADDLVGRAVQVTTIAVGHGILVAGGFEGELVVKQLHTGQMLHFEKVTQNENAITNALDVFTTRSGAPRVLVCSNDCAIRIIDVPSFSKVHQFDFTWPVNYASRQPNHGKLMCVVGDDLDAILADGDTGKSLHSLRGHRDYSFAASWHPGGYMFATGNQDSTARVWDVRNPSRALCVLGGHLGAIRSLRFSSDGSMLAMTEPADFVHIYDTTGATFERSQEIDFFGEIAGFAFSPCTEALYVGVSDDMFGSLLEYERDRSDASGRPCGLSR